MSKKKRPVSFEIPRDEDGHFLPKEMWTKKEIREHDRLKREGLLSNPMRKVKVSGKKRAKSLYIQPQGAEGKFIPREQWSEAERKLAEKAQKEGKTIAAQLPRDDKGRFLSPTGKKSKKKKGQIVPDVEYPVGPVVMPGDARGLHQGNVTVVYPPYPPHAPPPAPVQMVPQSPASQRPIYIQLSDSDREFVTVPESSEEYGQFPTQTGQELILEDFDINQCDPCLLHVLDRQADTLGLIIDSQGEIKQLEGKVKKGHQDLKEGQRRQLKALSYTRKPGSYAIKPGETPKDFKELEAQLDLPFDENPSSRYPMYYVRRSFSERVGDGLRNLASSPLLAIVAIGAVVAIGYALYRAFKAFRFRTLNSVGVEIVNGTIYFPGEEPYVITEEDKLWLARSIWGEVNRDPSAWARSDVQQGGAAVLWAFANHYITVGAKRNLYATLGDFVQAYSQPINPRWDSASDSRCQANPAMCTQDRLAFRQELRNTPWSSFPPALQNLVLNFAAGQVQNPVGTRTDFRASGTGYMPPDPLNVAGNIFGTADNARRRPVEQVA